MGETVLDTKGRVAVPKEIREKLNLREGAKLKVSIEERKIIITPPISPEEFVKEMEGFVRIDIKESPLEVKKIWESKAK